MARGSGVEREAIWEITLIASAGAINGVSCRGVFRALLSFLDKQIKMAQCAIGRAESQGSVYIDLEVRADNGAAIRAYEREAFLAVGRRKAYYRDGADAILYRRTL
jgi:ribosomal protein S18 acetylase RimI-like enzyme